MAGRYKKLMHFDMITLWQYPISQCLNTLRQKPKYEQGVFHSHISIHSSSVTSPLLPGQIRTRSGERSRNILWYYNTTKHTVLRCEHIYCIHTLYNSKETGEA